MTTSLDPKRWKALALRCSALRRAVHRNPRHLDHRRGPACHPGRPRLHRRRYELDLQRLCHRLRRSPPPRRRTCRCLRRAPHLPLGLRILTGASAMAGLAGNQEVLLAGRALQGVGAALIAPSRRRPVLRRAALYLGGRGIRAGLPIFRRIRSSRRSAYPWHSAERRGMAERLVAAT